MLRLLLIIVAVVHRTIAYGQTDTSVKAILFDEAKARFPEENVNLVAAHYNSDINALMPERILFSAFAKDSYLGNQFHYTLFEPSRTISCSDVLLIFTKHSTYHS
jgi:hypothetical protein